MPWYQYQEAIFRNGNYQNQTMAEEPFYTSVVVDMIDNENQRFSRNHAGNPAFPLDNVEGYNILQIEQALRGATSWAE
jgi:hypothetical protein